MKTRLSRNLQIGFGVSLLILILTSVASYVSIESLLKSSDLVDQSNQVIQKLEYTLTVMKDAETGQRGYLLTGYDEFLEPFRGSYQKALQASDDFQKLTKDNPQQQWMAVTIKRIISHRLNILQQMIDKKRDSIPITTIDLLNGKLSMDSLRSTISHAELIQKRLLYEQSSKLTRYTSDTPFFLFIATMVATAITALSYLRVMSEVSERTRLYAELADQEQKTAAINDELKAANEELALTNEDLAAANEELNAANEELVNTQAHVNELNEKLGSANQELSSAVDELYKSQLDLKLLNNELEERVTSRTKALAESESRFRVMMETMPQIAWTSTNEGEITFFNKQWYTYTGLNYEQSSGWGWTVTIHPDDLPAAAEKYKAILASGKEGEFEARKKRIDSTYHWHLVRIQPVVDDKGEPKLWVGTATDIQDLKHLQQQKDDFISIASHELKTPITSLKASLQFLDRIKDTPESPTLPKLIVQANKSLEKLNILVEDLLNVSKLNQGQINLHKSMFNVYQLVHESSQYIRMEGVYSIVIDGDRELVAYADPQRIEQILVNFLNNAIKYASSSKEIRIGITREDGMAKVSVTDKGPGIHPDKVPHLFDRYFRVDSSGMQFSGLGLGLYISSEIIKKHGGQIGVNTQPGGGSTFWFKLSLQDDISLN